MPRVLALEEPPRILHYFSCSTVWLSPPITATISLINLPQLTRFEGARVGHTLRGGLSTATATVSSLHHEGLFEVARI